MNRFTLSALATLLVLVTLLSACAPPGRPTDRLPTAARQGTEEAAATQSAAHQPEATVGAPTSLASASALPSTLAPETAGGESAAWPSPSEEESGPKATEGPSADSTPVAAATEAPTADPTIAALAANFKFPTRGDPNAALQIYEFSDYLCPYCRKLALETMSLVVRDYVNSGKAAIVFVDFPLIQLHGYTALISHEAAHCAGEEGKYWQMHDVIFQQGERLSAVDPMAEDAARQALIALARPAGVNADRLRLCLESGKYRPIIGAIMQDASSRGVELTPTLLVGDELVPGYVSYDQLKPVIERQLSKLGAAP